MEDLTLTPEETNKTLFSDIQEGDQTFFTDYILQTGNDTYITLLKSLRRKNLSDENIHDLQTMFEESGAIIHGKALISQHLQKAEQILEHAKDMSDEYKVNFHAIVDLLRIY